MDHLGLLEVLDDPPGPSPDSRAAIESCHPVTSSGPVQLDRSPDVEQILLLADELRLDELLALEWVQRGYAQVQLALGLDWQTAQPWRHGIPKDRALRTPFAAIPPSPDCVKAYVCISSHTRRHISMQHCTHASIHPSAV
jgi:hypothetical protein